MKYLLIICMFLIQANAKEKTVEQLFNVQTTKVKLISDAKSIKSFGFVKVDEARVYNVTPRFGGFVEKLYANTTYKKVEKGEKLALVYSPEVLKAKDDYLNTINYTKSRPNKTMLKSAVVKLSLLNVSKNEINQITNNKKTSSFTTIISPANGYIFKKSINNNSAFNAKEVLFKIVNLDKIWVELKIHQNQLSLVKNIDDFTLSTPALKQTFKATKAGVYPELDPKEESFTLRLLLDNKQNLLKPGMYITAIMRESSKNYLTLPSTAVIRKNGKFYVFIVGEYEGEYEPLEIQVEVLNPNTYIVKSELNAGDEVVNNALFMMDSDAQVNGLY
ncbi:efflux RND transporter periplasmic adaptor subunit [Sulfurimonas sp.]|uniref:efflux RND transporter periplasmic adaptor subunit n=1 Tax=Sulfurimonas sp. TaxID=2022749 RepID=UPI002AB0BF04|nr:efflux RND transporter periplasmic adaptor subunit [Sulfurimonas sp.]